MPLFNLALAHDLYVKLLGDMAPVFAKKRRLLVVSSGALTSLPLHLLVKTKPRVAQPTRQQAAVYREADWMVRSHAISVLPSVESLKALRRPYTDSTERKPLIGFGNPLPSTEQPLPRTQLADASTPKRGPGQTRSSGNRRRSLPSGWSGSAVSLEALRTHLAKHPLIETEAELRAVKDALGGAEAVNRRAILTPVRG